MDTFSENDLSGLKSEEILAMYTRRIAELSALIESNAYLLYHLEKSRGHDPKKIKKN